MRKKERKHKNKKSSRPRQKTKSFNRIRKLWNRFKDYYLWLLIIAIIVPFGAEKILQAIGLWSFTNITAPEWLGYGATLLGTYATIVALTVTIRHNREMMIEQDRRNSVPVLHLTGKYLNQFSPEHQSLLSLPYDTIELSKPDDRYNEGMFMYINFNLANIGRGPALDIKPRIKECIAQDRLYKFGDNIPQDYVVNANCKLNTPLKTPELDDNINYLLEDDAFVKKFTFEVKCAGLSSAEYLFTADVELYYATTGDSSSLAVRVQNGKTELIEAAY